MQNQISDPYGFSIQLDTIDAGRDFHRFNHGHEIQRPDVVDDICRGMLLQARIDRIVHGRETKDGKPATLVVFGFRFHGLDERRRFRRSVITVTFQDAKKREQFDPAVMALWPNGDFTLGEPTVINTDMKTTGDVSATTTVGNFVQTGIRAGMNWEHSRSFKQPSRSSLTGSVILNNKVRKYGLNNAFRLTISENSTTRSGLVTDIRAAVLLTRQSEMDEYHCTVEMEAEAFFSYQLIKGIRNICGFSAPNDPVIFKPGVQYLRPPTLHSSLEAKLAQEIDEFELNAKRLDELAGVLSTTVLVTSV